MDPRWTADQGVINIIKHSPIHVKVHRADSLGMGFQYVIVDSSDTHRVNGDGGSKVTVRLLRPIINATAVEVVSVTTKNEFFNIREGANVFYIGYRVQSALSDNIEKLPIESYLVQGLDTRISNKAVRFSIRDNPNLQFTGTYGSLLPILIEPGVYTMVGLAAILTDLLRPSIWRDERGGVTFATQAFRMTVVDVFTGNHGGGYVDADKLRPYLVTPTRNAREYRNSMLDRMGFNFKGQVTTFDQFTNGLNASPFISGSRTLSPTTFNPVLLGDFAYHENHSHMFLTSDLVINDVQRTYTPDGGIAGSIPIGQTTPSDALQMLQVDSNLYNYIHFASNGNNAMKHMLHSKQAISMFTISLTDESGKLFEEGSYRPFQVMLKFETAETEGSRLNGAILEHNKKMAFLSRHGQR